MTAHWRESIGQNLDSYQESISLNSWKERWSLKKTLRHLCYLRVAHKGTPVFLKNFETKSRTTRSVTSGIVSCMEESNNFKVIILDTISIKTWFCISRTIYLLHYTSGRSTEALPPTPLEVTIRNHMRKEISYWSTFAYRKWTNHLLV